VGAAALALILDALILALERGIRKRRRGLLVGSLSVLGVLFAYTAVTLTADALGRGRADVTIGAKTFTEQYILSEIMAGKISGATGLDTETMSSLGSTVAFDALKSGDIDVYVDYSGTLWATILKRETLKLERETVLAEVATALEVEHGVVVVGALGLALARVRRLPITRLDAVLLATGLTLCNLPATVLVAAWFVLLVVKPRLLAPLERRWLKNAVQVLTAGISVIAVLALVVSVPSALLGSPEMQITGYGSSGYYYRWFSDHAGESLPTAWVFSLPLWIYRGAMLAWSLWLAFALLRWLKWAWPRWATPVAWFAKQPATNDG